MVFKEAKLFFFSILYILQQKYPLVAGEIVVNENGFFQNKTIFETLNIIGPKQCVRECQRRDYCKAVNYRKDMLECHLLWTSVSNTTELIPDEKYQFISMASQRENLKECNSSCKDRQCIQTSSEQDYCVANTCPVEYRYNKTLKFCYLMVDVKLDYSGAMTYCEDIGSRLAKVPTMDHYWYLYTERQNNWLISNKFRIGGDFNVTAGEWQWLDGSMVFSSMNRTETRVETDDGELFWDESDILRNLESDKTERLLCERII